MSAPAPVRDKRIPVAVLGATGIVGQHLVQRLETHPTLRLAEVVGSAKRASARYGAVVRWALGDEPPRPAADLRILRPDAKLTSPIVLSAVPARAARELEPRLASEGHLVCTNASEHRESPTVPLVIPEVNASALELCSAQEWADRGGAVVANPNCMVAGLALALTSIEREWGIRSGAVVTLQALSGAGLSGPSALAMTGNVIPWINGEEEKRAAQDPRNGRGTRGGREPSPGRRRSPRPRLPALESKTRSGSDRGRPTNVQRRTDANGAAVAPGATRDRPGRSRPAPTASRCRRGGRHVRDGRARAAFTSLRRRAHGARSQRRSRCRGGVSRERGVVCGTRARRETGRSGPACVTVALAWEGFDLPNDEVLVRSLDSSRDTVA